MLSWVQPPVGHGEEDDDSVRDPHLAKLAKQGLKLAAHRVDP